MEVLLLLLLVVVGSCCGGEDTEEALAHYIVTPPPTDHPYSSAEKRVYKDIEEAIHNWQTAPETEDPLEDSEGKPITPEPRAPRWWNQYMQEKYGDPPVFPDWSNETQIDNYMLTKKRKKWTPSQESFEPMKPDEEPFTWVPFLKDSNAWTQPTWDPEEIKRLGDQLQERHSSGGGGSYEDGNYEDGDSNSTDVSEDTRSGAAVNKSANGLSGRKAASRRAPVELSRRNKLSLWKQRNVGHVPAQNGGHLMARSHRAMRRKDALKAQLSPEDVETARENQARRSAARREYEKMKKTEALRRLWDTAVIKKLREGAVVGAQVDRQEFKARRRRPVAGEIRRNLERAKM